MDKKAFKQVGQAIVGVSDAFLRLNYTILSAFDFDDKVILDILKDDRVISAIKEASKTCGDSVLKVALEKFEKDKK